MVRTVLDIPLVARLARLVVPPKVTTVTALSGFMARHAAFVAQKALSDHFRGYLGYEPTRLEGGRDPELARAMRACRETSYAAVLEDVAEVADIYLRHATGLGPELPPVLAGLARDALLAQTGPARPDPEVLREAIETRLARALIARPTEVRLLGEPTMRRMVAALPGGTSATRDQRAIMLNSIRFLLVRAYADLEAQADPVPLAADLQRAPRSTA
jgi:hypothetical protein